jgi:hypothetical protein
MTIWYKIIVTTRYQIDVYPIGSNVINGFFSIDDNNNIISFYDINFNSIYTNSASFNGTNIFNNGWKSFYGINKKGTNVTSILLPNITSSSVFNLSSDDTQGTYGSLTTSNAYYQNGILFNIQSISDPLPVGCFLADSKILTNKQLVPIQLLKKGDLVQTLNDGLLPVKFVGVRSFFNKLTEERIISHLYKLNKNDFHELLEDLYVTGGHPLLVDEKDLDKETKKKLLDMDNTPIITEGKYRVFAMLHPKAELWNDEREHEIFDIVLENEDPKKNYGIWVNGILTESMDEEFFLKYSGMTEINK